MTNLITRMSGRRLAVISLIGIAVLLAMPYFLPPYYLGLVVKMMIFALFAMSLDLLLGYTGMASLGHAAYFGVAAYVTGLLALKLGWSVWLTLPAGILMAALTALFLGLLALRTRGSYFLMITLALSQVVWGIAFGWRSLTGGDDGLPEVPRPEPAAAVVDGGQHAVLLLRPVFRCRRHAAARSHRVIAVRLRPAGNPRERNANAGARL